MTDELAARREEQRTKDLFEMVKHLFVHFEGRPEKIAAWLAGEEPKTLDATHEELTVLFLRVAMVAHPDNMLLVQYVKETLFHEGTPFVSLSAPGKPDLRLQISKDGKKLLLPTPDALYAISVPALLQGWAHAAMRPSSTIVTPAGRMN